MLESLDDLNETTTGVYENKAPTETAVFDGTATATVQTPAEPPAEERETQVDIAMIPGQSRLPAPPRRLGAGDGDRTQEFSDQRGQTLQERLALATGAGAPRPAGSWPSAVL